MLEPAVMRDRFAMGVSLMQSPVSRMSPESRSESPLALGTPEQLVEARATHVRVDQDRFPTGGRLGHAEESCCGAFAFPNVTAGDEDRLWSLT